jgi:hypothetical protein
MWLTMFGRNAGYSDERGVGTPTPDL